MSKKRYLFSPKFFTILVGFILFIGIFFRCYNLDRKLYWHDEVYTSIRTAGYNGAEVVHKTFTGEVITVKELLRYQGITPEKNWKDSLDKLIEHPEHPPLYYLLSRAWQQIFGSSIATTRSLSVLFSLLLFPALYWLCRELFDTEKVSWFAIALVAVSPVHVLYAQEAREYSLLVLTTTLSYATLVGAIKRDSWLWWLGYVASLTANLYVSLLGGYIAIAQAVYISILEKFRFTKNIINFIAASVLSLVLFSPWLWVIKEDYGTLKAKTSWTNMEKPFVELLRFWELHLNSSFIDLHPSVNGYISVRIIGFVLIFVLICYRFLVLHSKPRTSLLLITLALVPSAMLILPDAIGGGIKSIMTRYFLLSLLAVQITVAYWLSHLEIAKDIKRTAILSFILLLGIISCAISSQSNTWWSKVVGYHNPQIAAIINQVEKPLLIAQTTVKNNPDVNVGDFISIAHLLQEKVDLMLYKNQNIPIVDFTKYSDILLWDIKEDAREKFQEINNCELTIVEGDYYPHLWTASPTKKATPLQL